MSASGDRELERLLLVSRSDPGYRAACVAAIRRAAPNDTMTMELDNFLGDFIRSGPRGDAEAAAFYDLAALYLRTGFVENAREASVKLLRAAPPYRDAAALLASIATNAPPPIAELPALPALPTLPPPPAPRTRVAVPAPAGSAGPDSASGPV